MTRRRPVVLWGNVRLCRLCLDVMPANQDGDAHPECEAVEHSDICVECGNDLAAEGQELCTDCLEETETRPPVHLYRFDRRSYPDQILCRDTKGAQLVHATELGSQVTCPACRAIMRGLEPEEPPPSPW